MKRNRSSIAGDVNNADCPLASLVLLAATHHPKDAPELLKPLGVGQAEIERFSRRNANALDTIQKMAMAGALLDRDTFAKLIRVRVGVKLIETEDPRQLATLVTAAAKLPGWVFGEAEPVVQQPNSLRQQNGVVLDSSGGMVGLNGMGLQQNISEAKPLTKQRKKHGKVRVR